MSPMGITNVTMIIIIKEKLKEMLLFYFYVLLFLSFALMERHQ